MGETSGTHTRFEENATTKTTTNDNGATHTRFSSPESEHGDSEMIVDNLLSNVPSEIPRPEFVVPEVPQPGPSGQVSMEIDSGDGSKKRTRSKDADDPAKRPKIRELTAEEFDRIFAVDSPEQDPADQTGGDAKSDDQTGKEESADQTGLGENLDDQTENDSSFTSASTSCLDLTDTETTIPGPSFYVQGSLSKAQKEQRLRAQIETHCKWLWEFDQIDRLDLVKRTYQIPSAIRSVTQIRDYLADTRHDLRFSRSSYSKCPRVRTWPKVVVEEKYSRVNSDPAEGARQTELGDVICPKNLSYFQLMRLCIDYEISLSPESATTRDRLLGRVENFVRVSESVTDMLIEGDLWFVYKEGGVSSNNTSLEALASE